MRSIIILIIVLKCSRMSLQTFLLCSLRCSKNHLQCQMLNRIDICTKIKIENSPAPVLLIPSCWSNHHQHCPSGFRSIYFYNHFLWTNLSNHSDNLQLFHISTNSPRRQQITVNITCRCRLRNHLDLKAKIMLIFPLDSPHPTKCLAFQHMPKINSPTK